MNAYLAEIVLEWLNENYALDDAQYGQAPNRLVLTNIARYPNHETHESHEENVACQKPVRMKDERSNGGAPEPQDDASRAAGRNT